MVSSQISDYEPQADVVFVLEATSMNGTFINELKTNYIQPILEYFNRGPIENSEMSCNNRNILYTIILYHAADVRPKPCCRTFAQERDPQFILSTIDKINLSGGKAQANANIVEGLATCLQFFDDIKQAREGCQKFCILICSSPPYAITVMENEKYAGNSLEQLAAQFFEKNILMSVLSPRKIPVLFKLYENTGGDLTHALSKNYSKNTRHLVLLNGFSLKERAMSPSNVNAQNALSIMSPISNSINVDSPAPASNVPFRQATPQAPPMLQIPTVDLTQQQQIQSQVQQSQQIHTQSQQSQVPSQPPTPQQQIQLNPQQMQLPNPNSQIIAQHQNQMNSNAMPGVGSNFNQHNLNFNRAAVQGQTAKWPVQGGQPRQFQNSPQQPSTLINQLKQPPNTMPPQFRFDGSQISHQTVNVMNPNPNQQMQFQQMRMNRPNMMTQHPMMNLNPAPERPTMWQGIIEWIDKQAKDPSEATKHVPCTVTSNAKDGQPEVKVENWPNKLSMQLLPKQLISSIGNSYLKNSTSVLFHPTRCEALETLTKVMSSGYAGCIHFNNSVNVNCDIKVLILLYTSDKRVYLGFIPNDQNAFLERLFKLVQQQRKSRQLQAGQALNQGMVQNQTPVGNMQGQQSHMTSAMMPVANMNNPLNGQQNHMAGLMVAGGMPHSNMNPSDPMMQANQQAMLHQNPNANLQQGPMGLRGNTAMMGQRPETSDPVHVAMARQRNLAKIQQLRQTLEAAQQQEMQYQTQLEQQPPYGGHQMMNMQKPAQQQPGRDSLPNMQSQNPQFNDGSGYDFLN